MKTFTRQGRLPRYKRATTAPTMQITDRDVAILEAVCEMRFLTSDQIQLLLFSPSTASSCRRRLTLLYHNAYLDRMLIPAKNALGSTRAVYLLAKRGAEFIARARHCPIRHLDWQPDQLDRELYFIRHTLAINDFRITLTIAARADGISVEWIDERTLRRRGSKDYLDDPKHQGRRLAAVPDGHFSLTYDGRTFAFAVEVDRSTVEERPFKDKIRAYGEWKVTGAHQRRYGTNSLRVLWIVADTSRDHNRMSRIKLWTEAEGGRSLFWFILMQDLAPQSMLFEQVWWKAGSNDMYPLLRRNNA